MLGVIDTEHAQPMLFPKIDTNNLILLYGAHSIPMESRLLFS